MNPIAKGRLDVKLTIVVGEAMQSADLVIYKHHKPALLVADSMIKPLQMPASQQGRRRRVYSKRLDRFLDENRSYGEQGVRAGDVLVLTDLADIDAVRLLAETTPTIEPKGNLVDQLLESLKNYPITAGLIVLGIVVIGLGAFTDAIAKIVKAISSLR